MIKQKRYGNTLKEQYRASARDRITVFLLGGDQVRGARRQIGFQHGIPRVDDGPLFFFNKILKPSPI